MLHYLRWRPLLYKISRPEGFYNYLIDSTRRSLIRDSWLGISIYFFYILADYFYIAPANYHITWTIRLTVVAISIAGIMLLKTNHPQFQKYPRPLFIAAMSLVLNSYIPIWYFASEQGVPADAALPAMTLMFMMSFFVMFKEDALLIGAIYCLGFFGLLAIKDVSQGIWYTYLMALGGAYVMGAMGAIIGENYVYRSFLQEKLLNGEKHRAERLIERTFPLEVANELKANHESPARRAENVSVLFCDIANFTQASSAMSPEALVEWLSQTFSTIDKLVAEHGCEKIKTIGDSYMAVCGVPSPVSDHAVRIVKLAIAIKKISKTMTLNGRPLEFRIGINSGPVVAGVIGESRYAYDLWGDTVNTASRMESLAPIGGIQITEATMNLLGSQFHLKSAGVISVKGKGTMEAWLVGEPINKRQLGAMDAAA
jgi:class 3 adenylate cyclase